MSKAKTILFTPTGCLTLDAVYRYQEGELENSDCHRVEKHLVDCELCTAAVDHAAGTDREAVKKITASVNKLLGKPAGGESILSILIADYGKWVALAAAVLVIGFLVFSSLPDKNAAEQIAENPVQIQPETVVPPETLAMNQPVITPVDSAAVIPNADTLVIAPAEETTDSTEAEKEKAAKTKELEEKKKAEKEKKETEKKEKKKKESEKQSEEAAPSKQEILITSVEITDKYVISEAKVSDATAAKKKKKKNNSDPAFAAGVDSSGRPPEFDGGDDRLKQYVKDNISLPADYSGEKGIATVSFTVTPDGKVSDVTLQKGLSETVDNELIRVAHSIPDWKPGEPGKSSKVKMSISVKVGE